MKTQPELSFGSLKRSKITLPALDNVITRHDFTDSNNYTFSSGVVVSSVAALEGLDFTAFDDPEYDATALGGQGGIKFAGAADYLRYASNITDWSDNDSHGIAMILSVPNYTSGEPEILQFSTTGNGYNTAQLKLKGAGNLIWRANEAGSYENVSTTGGDADTYIVIINIASESSAVINVLSASGYSNAVSFDPRNADTEISGAPRIRLGSRTGSAGLANMVVGAYIHVDDTFSAAEIAQIQAYWTSVFF